MGRGAPISRHIGIHGGFLSENSGNGVNFYNFLALRVNIHLGTSTWSSVSQKSEASNAGRLGFHNQVTTHVRFKSLKS